MEYIDLKPASGLPTLRLCSGSPGLTPHLRIAMRRFNVLVETG
jgi:hypothetical protein